MLAQHFTVRHGKEFGIAAVLKVGMLTLAAMKRKGIGSQAGQNLLRRLHQRPVVRAEAFSPLSIAGHLD